jgi:hypothetical protein
MSERHHHSAEKHTLAKSAELEHKASEQLKKVEHALENASENKHELAEKARETIKKVETPAAPKEAGEPTKEPVSNSGITRRVNYEHTMKSLRRSMKPAQRVFSKVIHNPSIERASEVIGTTIFRPSVSLGATTTAVIVGGYVYLSARSYGFSLSGPELILAFVAGGIIGILAEALVKLIRQATK